MVTFIGVGTCHVVANQAGSAQYQSAAAVSVSIEINRVVPTLTLKNLVVSARVGSESSTFAGNSASRANITYSTRTHSANLALVACDLTYFTPISFRQCLAPNTCDFHPRLRALAVGTCFVTATQPADGNYAAATVTQLVSITKGEQLIDDILPRRKVANVGDAPIELERTIGNETFPAHSSTVFTTSSAPSICTVTGFMLTIVGPGTCRIVASKAENAAYDAAERIQNLSIFTPPSAVSFSAQSNVLINTQVTSNTVVVNGIAADTPISIASRYTTDVDVGFQVPSDSATYSIGCTNTFTSAPSTISNGQTVCIRVQTGNSTWGNRTIATLLIGATETTFTVNALDESLKNRYRIYIPSTGGHLFTTDKGEYDFLVRQPGTYVDEGVDHKMYAKSIVQNTRAQPYYRLYIKPARQHFWTSEFNEYNALRAQTQLFVDEGIDGYIFLNAGFPNSVPLYRLVLNNTAIHHWTTDKNEFDALVRSGSWLPEGRPENPSGVTGYVMPK